MSMMTDDALLQAFLRQGLELMERARPLLPEVHPAVDWRETYAASWHREGQSGYLKPVKADLSLRLTHLLGVDRQRETLGANTAQFVRGMPSNHALLWGARGTGKSSLIRALLAEYAPQGLRLIELDREHLVDLPQVIRHIQGREERFLVFCDDLSFDAGDADYRSLKSVLDGSLEQSTDNILLYATSNRRHLVSERQSDNADWQNVDGEIHPSEGVEDKIALSDRFGLWLSFYPFTQPQYLDVVRHWVGQIAARHGLHWQWGEEEDKAAVRWATARGNRNGRCAYQFARNWVGMKLLEGN